MGVSLRTAKPDWATASAAYRANCMGSREDQGLLPGAQLARTDNHHWRRRAAGLHRRGLHAAAALGCSHEVVKARITIIAQEKAIATAPVEALVTMAVILMTRIKGM